LFCNDIGRLMMSAVIFVIMGLKSYCMVSFLGSSDICAPKNVMGMSFPSGGNSNCSVGVLRERLLDFVAVV
jgi:hypothetical protein